MKIIKAISVILFSIAAHLAASDDQPYGSLVKFNPEFVETYIYPDKDIRYDYTLSRDMYSEPDPESEVVEGSLYNLENPISILDAISIYTDPPDVWDDPFGSQAYYTTWWKIKAGDKEGWIPRPVIKADYITKIPTYFDIPPIALVRYKKRFADFREGPEPEHKRVSETTGGKYEELRIRPEVAKGDIHDYVGGFDGWICAGFLGTGVWLPADKDIVDMYFLAYVDSPNEGATLSLYYVGEDIIERFYVRIRGYLDNEDVYREEPVVDIVTIDTEIQIYPKREIVGYGFEAKTYYYEYELAGAMNIADIESIAYGYGQQDDRQYLTFKIK